jgi:hypothetical protein
MIDGKTLAIPQDFLTFRKRLFAQDEFTTIVRQMTMQVIF